jgi:hypothetical protein
MSSPPSLVENPRKLKEKSRPKTTRAIVFFCSVGYLIQSGYMENCLATQNKRFFLFKGPGSFKNLFNNWRKFRVFKGQTIDTVGMLKKESVQLGCQETEN